ncbi:hypothetical protein K525DRAFT_274767 [Schizophyllum commune Loenen D]|nr:hypothetical protein K525DRAFT_274767 [Schizophyllum commune Loenen D]
MPNSPTSSSFTFTFSPPAASGGGHIGSAGPPATQASGSVNTVPAPPQPVQTFTEQVATLKGLNAAARRSLRDFQDVFYAQPGYEMLAFMYAELLATHQRDQDYEKMIHALKEEVAALRKRLEENATQELSDRHLHSIRLVAKLVLATPYRISFDHQREVMDNNMLSQNELRRNPSQYGLEQHLNNRTGTELVNSYARRASTYSRSKTEASYKYMLAFFGKTLLSHTETCMALKSKLEIDEVSMPFALTVLIHRDFMRDHRCILAARIQSNEVLEDEDFSDEEYEQDGERPAKRRRSSPRRENGQDFFGLLTKFIVKRCKELGRNIGRTPQWHRYLQQLYAKEKSEFPDDELALIPTVKPHDHPDPPADPSTNVVAARQALLSMQHTAHRAITSVPTNSQRSDRTGGPATPSSFSQPIPNHAHGSPLPAPPRASAGSIPNLLNLPQQSSSIFGQPTSYGSVMQGNFDLPSNDDRGAGTPIQHGMSGFHFN